MKPIKDLRKLNAISKKFNLKFDREYKYILNDYSLKTERQLKEQGYIIKFVSGCFYPFLFEHQYNSYELDYNESLTNDVYEQTLFNVSKKDLDLHIEDNNLTDYRIEVAEDF